MVEFDGDNGIGSHVSYCFHRYVLYHAAIGQDAAIQFDGSKYAGNCDGRAHGVGQIAVMQNDGFAALHISGYTAEWNRKSVEVSDVGVRECDSIQEQTRGMAGIEPVRPLEPILETERR